MRTLTGALIWCITASLAMADGKPIRLFNGKNLDGFYAWTVQTKYENPGIFTVEGGMLKVAGGSGDQGYFGGLVTKEQYSNYKLTWDYKWGGPTYGTRHGKSRDAGVLLHCIGPHLDDYPWLTSYEYQIIEGGTGDILVVNKSGRDDNGQRASLSITAEVRFDGKAMYFQENAPWHTWKDSGRLNWWGRDPKWTDTIGFRGGKDVESPLGQWTRCELIAKDDTLTFYVNGKLVNRAKGLNVTKGRILFQTEGAEVWYRDLILTPLD